MGWTRVPSGLEEMGYPHFTLYIITTTSFDFCDKELAVDNFYFEKIDFKINLDVFCMNKSSSRY